MKIVATSDLHLDLDNYITKENLNQFHQEILEEEPDVFIIAGDIIGLGKKHLPTSLESLKIPRAHNLLVAGNHDIWVPEGSSINMWLNKLPLLYSKAGFHMLDTRPVIINDVGFVGNIGWYDYSFAHPNFPQTKDRSYIRKQWKGIASWNDRIFVNIGMKDEEFNNLLIKRLASQIEQIQSECEVIVAVTHHVGFKKMIVPRLKNDKLNFCNAFMGSKKLGELLQKYEKVKYHICGHTHYASKLELNGLTSINPGSTYKTKLKTVINI